MTPAVVKALLERKPFVPFALLIGGTVVAAVDDPDVAWVVDEDATLCISRPGQKTSELIDLRRIERMNYYGRIERVNGRWPF